MEGRTDLTDLKGVEDSNLDHRHPPASFHNQKEILPKKNCSMGCGRFLRSGEDQN